MPHAKRIKPGPSRSMIVLSAAVCRISVLESDTRFCEDATPCRGSLRAASESTFSNLNTRLMEKQSDRHRGDCLLLARLCKNPRSACFQGALYHSQRRENAIAGVQRGRVALPRYHACVFTQPRPVSDRRKELPKAASIRLRISAEPAPLGTGGRNLCSSARKSHHLVCHRFYVTGFENIGHLECTSPCANL